MKTSFYTNLHTYRTKCLHKLRARDFVTTFLRQRAALLLRGNWRPPYPHSSDILRRAVQPHCEFRFLCPLQGRGGLSALFPRSRDTLPARSQLRRNFEKGGDGTYFLGVLQVVSTSLVRGRKQQLIAQEEEKGSLIWRPWWCSRLQPHGELISTWAIDRKERRGWKEEGGLLSVLFFCCCNALTVDMWFHQHYFPHYIYLLLSREMAPNLLLWPLTFLLSYFLSIHLHHSDSQHLNAAVFIQLTTSVLKINKGWFKKY